MLTYTLQNTVMDQGKVHLGRMGTLYTFQSARNLLVSRQEEPPALQDFMSRAKTMEHLEEYGRIQKFAEAKAQDKNLLLKRREERKKKEGISKNKGVLPRKREPEDQILPKEDYICDDEDERDAINQLTAFETNKMGTNDSDSD